LIVLGIDPGTIVTGYGIVEVINGSYKALDYGCIKPPQKATLPEKYNIIFDGINHLIDTYRPLMLSIETQFVDKNPQSAIKLGMARGVSILAAYKKGLSIHEYSPTKAKSAVTTGKASKEQVQKSIKFLLGLNSASIPSDAADALALAICHLNTLRF
jgi:crossover junction endodeoxyribonuclease RuvC